jgi:hypothetical protein
MIQRIQSIYLALAAVISGIATFVNIGSFIKEDRQFIYSMWSVKENVAQDALYDNSIFYLGMMGFLIAVLALVVVFLYKNRMKQISYCTVLMGLNLLWVFFVLYVVPEFVLKAVIEFNPFIAIILIPIILIWLAKKAIFKDEKTVRAADRLR